MELLVRFDVLLQGERGCSLDLLSPCHNVWTPGQPVPVSAPITITVCITVWRDDHSVDHFVERCQCVDHCVK